MDKAAGCFVYSSVKIFWIGILAATPAALFAHEGHSHVTLGGFSNLHPLIVHFPLTFICTAPILQMLALFQKQTLLQWTALAFLILGAGGAWLSSYTFHPDTTDLGDAANAVLKSHDAWAARTMVFTLLSLVPAAAALFFARFARALKILSLVLGLAAAACITITGEYGAALVHIHGVGAEGNYIKEPGEKPGP